MTTGIQFTYKTTGELDVISYVQGDAILKLITVKQAAEKLCVTERYVQRLCNMGVLIAIKPIRDYLIFEFSLEMFAKADDKVR